MRLPRRLLIIAICLFAVFVSCTLIVYVRHLQVSISDHYAASQVADMIVHYAVSHDGQLPKNWVELSQAYEYVNAGYNNFTREELRSRVLVDFERMARASAEDCANGRCCFIFLNRTGLREERASPPANEANAAVRAYLRK